MARSWITTLPACLLLFFWPFHLLAITLEELDPNREWRVAGVSISGNKAGETGELEEVMSTKERPWYTLWRPRPVFAPAVFASDLERLAQFYQDLGYYEAKVSYELEVDNERDLVAANIRINEGEPIRVSQISVEILDAPELEAELKSLLPKLALHEGKIFAVDAYQQTEAKLREFFYDRSRARVEIRRKAQVILSQHEARVFYTLKVGPTSVFGSTDVEGLKDVLPEVVLRELTYKPGEPFSGTKLSNSEKNIRELDLFSQMTIELQPSANDPSVVPIKIRLEEKPPREIKIGIGYGTEDQLRGQIRWRHSNWLGGARKLEIGVKASFITRELELRFLQPHFLGLKNRLRVNFGPQQFDEPGYFLNATKLETRIERKFTERFTGVLGYRLQYNRVSNVPAATKEELPGFQSKGLLSGLSAGLVWSTADDPLNPTTGWTLSFFAEQVGGFLGGQFDFYKLQGEVKHYHLLREGTVLASRLRIGFAEPFNDTEEVPIFERFYAGGSTSVRGYGRSRLGPLSSANEPVGGQSLLEGSIELRQQLFKNIGGVLFIDFGQVSLNSFDLPVDQIRFAAGFGVRYETPLGPLRLDVGFPFRPPRNDQSWRIYFSIGQAF